MIHKKRRNLKFTATLLASMMALGFGQVQANAQDFVGPEPGDEAYLPGYSLVEQYFPSVDAAVEYANANFNIDIHADFYVTMDENGAYVYYELLDDVEEPEEPEEPEIPEDNMYVVQPGDYLYRIANEFNITVQDIIDWNNLESEFLNVGQVLIIADPDGGEVPEEPDPEPEEPEDSIYVVQAGDYLYRIASEFGITVDELITWNSLESNSLYVGQELIVVNPDGEVEEPNPEDPEDIIYVVQSGDYLYRIASEFDVTVQDIIEWNNLENDSLQVGDELVIRQ